MRNVLVVFDALQRGLRPLTRVEIEAATGLVRDEVREALRSLKRRTLLVIDGAERERVRYSLVEKAVRPQDGRGRFVRTVSHCQLKASLRLLQLGRLCALPPSYSPARLPSHAAAAPRIGTRHFATSCSLAEALGYRLRSKHSRSEV